MARPDRLLHPAFVGAVALLAVNDHVLKDRWPGLITGKLSDFAGLFVVAVVAGVAASTASAAATRRRTGCDPGAAVVTAAVTLVALAFTALKLSPLASALAAPVLGGPTRTDPTDLVALAVVIPAHRFLTPPARRTPPPPTIGGHPNGAHQPGRGPWWWAALTVVVSLTTYSVTATSCEDPTGISGLGVTAEGLVASTGFAPADPSFADYEVPQYRSTDGGRTWTRRLPGSVPVPTTSDDTACLDDGRCFRVRDHRRVESRSGSGPWITAFEFTPAERDRIEARTNGCTGGNGIDNLFDSIIVASSASPAPPGDPGVVVVSMGTQGVLRYDPAADAWTRHGVGRSEPVDVRGPSRLRFLTFAPLLLVGFSPALYLVRRRTNPTSRRLIVAGSCALAGVAIGGFALMVILVTFNEVDPRALGPVTAGFSLVAFAVSLLVAMRPPPGGPPLSGPPPGGPPPGGFR